ncbi:MAG: hypothetical protein JNN01_04955 [Opitutaceae bacterium]|nr:hypothetical protein [Opitutaceae bacterium]
MSSFRLLFLASLTLVPGWVATTHAQTRLAGRVEGTHYVSPSGAYKISIPVLPELGGKVVDTPDVVTFEDDFNVHASLACFKMDATQRWEHETRGRRDYLVWFFTNFVQADFQGRFAGAKVESAKYIPAIEEGALLCYNLLPGGTMFADRPSFSATEEIFVAKRGNLLFMREGFVYVLSIELAERALERRSYDKTVAEEDEILRKRLLELLGRITFLPQTAAAK